MISISCLDLGSTCEYRVEGESMNELISDMQKHGREYHGYSDEEVTSPRMRARMKIAIMHSSRPPERRTTATQGWWAPHEEPATTG